MTRLFNFIAVLVIVLFAQNIFAQAGNQPLTGQRFTGQVTVNASPAKVWNVLTSTRDISDILGYQYVGGAKTLSSVGNNAKVKVWGDNGNFTLVRADKNRELRFSLDPENGSYICSCRWTIKGSGNASVVTYEERYTESSPQSKDDILAQVKDTNEKFKRLKMKAEK